MRNTTSIGLFIAALRKANGLTQKQLAEKLNVSDKAVSRWERDECAPDLSLIPVIAEIFGITSDELLRGQRAAPNTQPTPQSEEKAKKRLEYLLTQLKTRYKIQSILSIGIALVGLIAATILNAFNRAQAGFLVGCVFFLAAAICQTIFLILSRSQLCSEEFETDAVAACRSRLIKGAEWVFTVIAVLLAATAPLALAGDPYWGLTLPYWWSNSLLWILLPAILSPIVCHLVNRNLGIAEPISPKAKLRLKFAGILAMIVAGTMIVHLFAANLLFVNMYLFSPGTKFDNFQDYKVFMEIPLNPKGEPMTLEEVKTYPDGTIHKIYIDDAGIHYDAQYTQYILDDPNTGFYNANQTVRQTVTSGNGIYTYDRTQYTQAEQRFTLINWLIAIVYPAELIAVILRYRKKVK